MTYYTTTDISNITGISAKTIRNLEMFIPEIKIKKIKYKNEILNFKRNYRYFTEEDIEIIKRYQIEFHPELKKFRNTYYYVDKFGNIYNYSKNILIRMKYQKIPKEYCRLQLVIDGECKVLSVHRIVYELFGAEKISDKL